MQLSTTWYLRVTEHFMPLLLVIIAITQLAPLKINHLSIDVSIKIFALLVFIIECRAYRWKLNTEHNIVKSKYVSLLRYLLHRTVIIALKVYYYLLLIHTNVILFSSVSLL